MRREGGRERLRLRGSSTFAPSFWRVISWRLSSRCATSRSAICPFTAGSLCSGQMGRFVRTFVFVVNGFTAMGGGLPFPFLKRGRNAAFTPIQQQRSGCNRLPFEVDMEYLSSLKIGQLCACKPTVFCRYVLTSPGTLLYDLKFCALMCSF